MKDIQEALATRGFNPGPIDGLSGPKTTAAIREFQAVNGIKATGVVDARTRDLLGLPEKVAATLVMANQAAIRNKPITKTLHDKLIAAATAVYGPDCELSVYSGGQDRSGQGNRRTGSVRHDDYGQGGRAADVHVHVRGRKIDGIELAKLGQYWLAKKYGGCGLEMAVGGIHLDEWTTPPSGGGMLWTYAYSDSKSWGSTVRGMLVAGSRGQMP